MNWKDFIYYSKSEKIGSIVLLIAIGITSFLYLYSNNFVPEYSQEDIESLKEFEEFQKQLNVLDFSAQDKKLSKISAGETIDLNTASIQDLKKLPGIGETYALRIDEYKKSINGFTKTEQLLQVKGISYKKYKEILPFIRINIKETTKPE